MDATIEIAHNEKNRLRRQLAFLEARQRAHARVEDRIRHSKDTGLGRLPSREFTTNQTWLATVTIAADLSPGPNPSH